ncbi:hypothetical protein BDB00DRAFT_897580 [Zychaea mexicana]|uniref:uncharacterized protein n=1 Tax=Zychaea mexicana TaxID=64656 RepID=UPI0022FEB5B1|nr:uncharacterized protein BDB00DRAFT_897580 [Zychaea mexicana]KAI9495716.1 hypothetical protein BDB00DRAFT_897580 [Zychaea mexicana]
MESLSAHHTEDSARTNNSNNNHTSMAERDLVPDITTAQHLEAEDYTAPRDSSSTRRRSISPAEESPLDYDRLELKRRRLTASGLSTDATSIMLDPAHTQQRNAHYQPIQPRYICWTRQHDIDPFVANPAQLVNFLAYGHVHLGWATGTCANYRSAILDLYDDTSSFANDTHYKDFFSALNDQTIRSFDRPRYDIQPVIRNIVDLGNNLTMCAIDLTCKLCFLLAITGFLRPSDIERIDDGRTNVTDRHLRLVIARPKEKRYQQRIEKVIHIHRHETSLLCLVQTYVDYHTRFCQTPCRRSYPFNNGPRQYVYKLIWVVHNNNTAISAERISNHIKRFLDMIPRPEGTARPKARALGSTAAVQAGASLDDVLIYGS